MTAQLPSRERLEKIASWRETYGAGHNVMLPAEEAEALARFVLAAHEQEPVGHVIQQLRGYENPTYVVQMANEPEDGDEVFSHPAPVPAVPECFERLLAHAQGIAMGVDWNKGTAATHHRDKLCQAVKDCAAMLNGSKS
ncbi:hypothetical protein [Phytobacter diazotrophicus]|uniref:hypothetical protein n=1 Tax=Phytobacter diazotrophicus TaxID=395631 RepID=UPI002FF07EA2